MDRLAERLPCSELCDCGGHKVAVVSLGQRREIRGSNGKIFGDERSASNDFVAQQLARATRSGADVLLCGGLANQRPEALLADSK